MFMSVADGVARVPLTARIPVMHMGLGWMCGTEDAIQSTVHYHFLFSASGTRMYKAEASMASCSLMEVISETTRA